MKIVVDMNLSPAIAETLGESGFDAIHWSSVGDARASDEEILGWAGQNGYVLLTHDLDFGAILAATGAPTPSVVQVRTHDVTPAHLRPVLVRTLREHGKALDSGVLLSVDDARARVRILPLRR